MRIVILFLCCAAFALLTPAPAATATGRCAFVDVALFSAAEPKRQCFNLEMTCAPGETYGCFKVALQLNDGWIDDATRGRLRELAAPFGFIDPDGVHWDVPAGYRTDGASIPPFFRPVVGGPWTDAYVKAAVLHDFYIRRRTSNARAVHQLFFDALLASGVSFDRAYLMYLAVDKFGPDWKSIDLVAFERER